MLRSMSKTSSLDLASNVPKLISCLPSELVKVRSFPNMISILSPEPLSVNNISSTSNAVHLNQKRKSNTK